MSVPSNEPGPVPRKHAPPKAVYPRRLMGVWGLCAPAGVCPGRIFGAEASPHAAHAERRCAGVGSLTRGNLAARHADCARLVDQSGKKGWQKLDGPQRGQVHPGLIWQDAVRARPSSRERTWLLSFLGCRIAPGPCRSQSQLDGKMGVKRPPKGGKMATFAGTCYVACYGTSPLLSCGCVNCRQKERREIICHNLLFIKNLRRKPWFPNFQKSPKP